MKRRGARPMARRTRIAKQEKPATTLAHHTCGMSGSWSCVHAVCGRRSFGANEKERKNEKPNTSQKNTRPQKENVAQVDKELSHAQTGNVLSLRDECNQQSCGRTENKKNKKTSPRKKRWVKTTTAKCVLTQTKPGRWRSDATRLSSARLSSSVVCGQGGKQMV